MKRARSLQGFLTPDDAVLVAWFVRDEPWWHLLKARWQLRRMPKARIGKHMLDVRARLEAAQHRHKAKLKKQMEQAYRQSRGKL